ncbi:MAG: peptidylprolyl isomerase [Sulfuricurvum sp.]|nr:peptidylprolyl isomerase [Sulfuricurvum sp.]
MKKSFCISLAAFCWVSVLDARTIAPDEIKQFATQTFRINFDTAPENVQKNILTEYTRKVKLSESLKIKLKNDPEFIRLSEKLALELWTNRISNSINPTDEELKILFNDSKNLKISPRYKLRHIVVMQESFTDIMIQQLQEKKGEERDGLFNYFAATHSQDQNTKLRGGSLGWIDATALAQPAMIALQNKEVGSITKVDLGNNVWDIVLLDDIQPEHPATFEESKNYFISMLRKEAVEKEVKKIVWASKSVIKKPK